MRIMIVSLAVLAVVSASGCSNSSPEQPVDVNAAAAKAQGDIANYAAANVPKRAYALSSHIAAPTEATMPEAATAVVRRYFRLIAAHDYRGARDLWCEDGIASGLDDRAFAARYARYARYDVRIGPAGNVDTGAGQLHVAIPVTVYGTSRQGVRFSQSGIVMLHRVNDGVRTREAESHLWRIRSTSVEPIVPPTVAQHRSGGWSIRQSIRSHG